MTRGPLRPIPVMDGPRSRVEPDTRRSGYGSASRPASASMAVIACLRGVLVVALHADLSAVLAIHSQPEAPWGARLMLPSCIDRMAMVTYRSGTHGGPIVDVFNDEINRRRLPSIPALAAEASADPVISVARRLPAS